MTEGAAGMLIDCLRSWRRGPYPQSVSFAVAIAGQGDGEARWIHDIHNLVDLAEAMTDLTDRQVEVLYRYIVRGDRQAAIASIMGMHQTTVGAEIELALKELLTKM
jgi:DNA-directed RNA polymerase specialized sigma24 family protein